ncbi:hypothetical protein [Derxia lacustris]|uniref:hypothetical protein n=1 Tax=Derxia lacustris TaxID=764842 RepID=UPI000A17274B|nr:hypothetical protein [Derxia lacustris]
MLQYHDITSPLPHSSRRLLDDNGELAESLSTASRGLVSYALVAKAIVEHTWRLDDDLRAALKDLIDRA